MVKNQIIDYFKNSKFKEVLKKINFLNRFTDKKEKPEKKKKLLMFKAEVLIRDSKFPTALKVLDQALQIDVNDTAANYQKALCLFVLRRNKEAISFIDSTIEQNKKAGKEENFNFIVLKAGVLYSLGKKDYGTWLAKAKKLDKERAELFMKNYFAEFRQSWKQTAQRSLQV